MYFYLGRTTAVSTALNLGNKFMRQKERSTSRRLKHDTRPSMMDTHVAGYLHSDIKLA